MGDVAMPEVDASGDVVVVDAPSSQPTQPSSGAAAASAAAKRTRKRKRSSSDDTDQALAFGFHQKEEVADLWHRETRDLVRFFRAELVPKVEDDAAAEGVESGVTTQSLVARLMEGSALSLSKLCDEIYAKVQGCEGVTVASLAADVQFMGTRVRYGVDDGGLDLAGDEDEMCLWCWEARDLKLLPKYQRPLIKFLREARKKVRGRIAALSVSKSAVLKSANQQEYSTELQKAVQRISQESGVAGIRCLIEKFKQRNSANSSAEKEAKLTEKQTMKEAEKAEKEKLKEAEKVEKEKLKAELELQKEKARIEKELRKQKEEAEKEERRREKEEKKRHEKEELESKKQLKRQQEEVERERKRREKEEAELKSKLILQKQANIMERFLKNKCTSANPGNSDVTAKPIIAQVTDTVQTLVTSMDQMFCQDADVAIEDIQKNQLGHWKSLCCFGRKIRWGVRVTPKMDVVKEIRLQGKVASSKATVNGGHESSSQIMTTNSSSEQMAIEMDDVIVIDDDVAASDVADVVQLPPELSNRVKKLLQFDKSHRPAYYGTWSKGSDVVGPRKPLAKDPTLDYDVDSDEEWEEEEPGESLTDCEKDDTDETEEVEVNCEDDSEDSFVVPDGYLSESERDDVDSPVSANANGDPESSISCANIEPEEFRLLRQHHKYLGGLIEKALRRSQPLIISNLMHEKSEPVAIGDLSGAMKTEQICLQALTMQACTGASSIELPNVDLDAGEVICEVPHQNTTPASAPAIDDSVLPEIITTIRSCSGGINKVVEALHQKFPAFLKTHMKNKVKEIADFNFVENQWKIKKEVTDRLGLSPERVKKSVPVEKERIKKTAPQEKVKKTKGIAAFFSKRCLPPTEANEVTGISPLQMKSQIFPRDAIEPVRLNQQQFGAEGK